MVAISVYNLAIAVATAFLKILFVRYYVTCSIYLQKAIDGASLGAHVAWAKPPQIILAILAVAVVSFLAVATVANDAMMQHTHAAG